MQAGGVVCCWHSLDPVAEPVGFVGNPVDELIGHKQLCPFQAQGAKPFSQIV